MTVLFFSLFNISKEQELSGSFLFRLLNIIPKYPVEFNVLVTHEYLFVMPIHCTQNTSSESDATQSNNA